MKVFTRFYWLIQTHSMTRPGDAQDQMAFETMTKFLAAHRVVSDSQGDRFNRLVPTSYEAASCDNLFPLASSHEITWDCGSHMWQELFGHSISLHTPHRDARTPPLLFNPTFITWDHFGNNMTKGAWHITAISISFNFEELWLHKSNSRLWWWNNSCRCSNPLFSSHSRRITTVKYTQVLEHFRILTTPFPLFKPHEAATQPWGPGGTAAATATATAAVEPSSATGQSFEGA